MKVEALEVLIVGTPVPPSVVVASVLVATTSDTRPAAPPAIIAAFKTVLPEPLKVRVRPLVPSDE